MNLSKPGDVLVHVARPSSGVLLSHRAQPDLALVVAVISQCGHPEIEVCSIEKLRLLPRDHFDVGLEIICTHKIEFKVPQIIFLAEI